MTTLNYEQKDMTLEKQLKLYDSLVDHPNPKLRTAITGKPRWGVPRKLVELGFVEIAVGKDSLLVRAIKKPDAKELN